MSFVGYDYIKQRGMLPEADGAVANEMFDSQ
jgi:hypothetical protein